MQDNDIKKKEAYKFFKEKFNIDFENCSMEKARMIIDEMNMNFDKQILEEKKKQIELTNQIMIESQKIRDLQEYID